MEEVARNIKTQVVKEYLSARTLFDKLVLIDSRPDTASDFAIIKEINYLVRLGLYISILCQEGFFKIRIGYTDYVVRKNDFIVIPYQKVFDVIEADENFKAKIICLEPDFFQFENNPVNVEILHYLKEHPHQSLPTSKTELFISVIDNISSAIGEEDNIYRKQIVIGYLNILFLELCNLLSQRKNIAGVSTPHEDVFKKFTQHIETNFQKERSVAFYAEKASLTPKYFSSVIFRLTGKHAKDWIDQYTILEAKAMLKSTRLTIQEISYELNFATPSHFGRYFKHHTRFSPLQYRNS